MMKHIIVCVHGTFAAQDSDEGHAWWQKGGVVANALKKNWMLSQNFEFHSKCFHWSGANSLHERQQAAEDLLEFVLELEKSSRPYHLIGHSHGGSVIWAMLRRVSASPTIDLKYLVSWLTVGTPFIVLKKTLKGALLGLVLNWLSMLLLIAYLGVSLWIFLDQSAASAYFPGWVEVYFLPIAIICLYVLLYAYVKSRDHRPDPGSVIVNTERRELLEKFVGKWVGVWSSDDEAIAALRTSVNNKLTPIASRPWIKRSGWAENPFWVRSIFEFPIVLGWNVVFRPIANYLFRNTVVDASLGIDRPGLVAVDVVPWPRVLGSKANLPSLPYSTEQSLLDHTNAALLKCVPAVRKAFSDVSIGIDANSAFSPETVNILPDALIHTSYFRNKLVLEAIFSWLLIRAGVSDIDQQKTAIRNYFGAFEREKERLVYSLLERKGD